MATPRALSFEEIQNMVRVGDYSLFLRTKEMEDRYTERRTQILDEWATIEDNIRCRFLGGIPGINKEGRKICSDESQDLHSSRYKPSVPALTLNEFPYHVASDVTHYVLWNPLPLTHDQIREHLGILSTPETKQVDTTDTTGATNALTLPSTCNIVFFEQEHRNKSVKGVWHIHIFVRERGKNHKTA